MNKFQRVAGQKKNVGLLVPPLTPFTEDLRIDVKALHLGIDYIVDHVRPTTVIAAGVEAQEYQFLSFEERRALIEQTIKAVNGRIPVAAGISHPSFRIAIELAKLDFIHGIKESSRDLARVSRLIVEIDHAGHAHYYTTMQMLLITLQLGGSGITLPSPAAELARHVVDAYEAGDIGKATQLQLKFATFPARWMPFGLAAVMKAASNFIGIPAGKPYPPYAPVSGDALAALHHFLSTTDLTRKELLRA